MDYSAKGVTGGGQEARTARSPAPRKVEQEQASKGAPSSIRKGCLLSLLSSR